jgi:TnpA family transposase
MAMKNELSILTKAEHLRTLKLATPRNTSAPTEVLLVSKLSDYPSGRRILQVLTEYNRLIKAQYLLDYIDDASLRQYVQQALNRGEP